MWTSAFFFFLHQPQGSLDDKQSAILPSFHSTIQLYFPLASLAPLGLFDLSRLEKKENSFKGSKVSVYQ